MGPTYCMFDFLERGSNITLHISDRNILYYHRNAYWLIMQGYSYFASPDYSVVQVWITATFLHPTNTLLTRPNVHHFLTFFLLVIKYFHYGNTIVFCHQDEAALDVPHCFDVTTFPIQ